MLCPYISLVTSRTAYIRIQHIWTGGVMFCDSRFNRVYGMAGFTVIVFVIYRILYSSRGRTAVTGVAVHGHSAGGHLVHVLVRQYLDVALGTGGLVRTIGITGEHCGCMDRIMLGGRHGVTGVATGIVVVYGVAYRGIGAVMTAVASHGRTINYSALVNMLCLDVPVMAGSTVGIHGGRKDVSGVMNGGGILRCMDGMAGFTTVSLFGLNSVNYLRIGAGVAGFTGHGLVGPTIDYSYVQSLQIGSFMTADTAICI